MWLLLLLLLLLLSLLVFSTNPKIIIEKISPAIRFWVLRFNTSKGKKNLLQYWKRDHGFNLGGGV